MMQTRKYRILSKPEYYKNSYKVACISENFIQKIRIWRNGNLSVLRQKQEVSEIQQQQYFDEKVFPLFEEQKPEQILFDFFLNDEFLGYGGIVHISYAAQSGEISFLLDPSITGHHYEEAFLNFLALMDFIGFREIGLNKLYTETYQTRFEHVPILERAGYKREGTLRQHKAIDGNLADVYFHGKLKSES